MATWIEASAPATLDSHDVVSMMRTVEEMAGRMAALGGVVSLHQDRLFVFMVKRLLECEALFRPLGYRPDMSDDDEG